MAITKCKITDEELYNLRGPVPIPVQVRLLLNKRGIKFEDDGTVSVIVNTNPQPLGRFVSWRDAEGGCTYYKQES